MLKSLASVEDQFEAGKALTTYVEHPPAPLPVPSPKSEESRDVGLAE